MAGERGADDGDDADRVLVEVGLHVLRADRVLVLGKRHDPRLDVEVAAELLPHDVDVAAEDQVGPVDRQVGRLAPLPPLPLQRQRAEHDRLGRALSPTSNGLARCVEEVGEHAHAALLDLGGDGVLRVVDEVAVEVFGDDPLRLRLHPGGDERGEVALRVALHDEVLIQQPHGVRRGHALVGEGLRGSWRGQEPVAEQGRNVSLGHADDSNSPGVFLGEEHAAEGQPVASSSYPSLLSRGHPEIKAPGEGFVIMAAKKNTRLGPTAIRSPTGRGAAFKDADNGIEREADRSQPNEHPCGYERV